LDPNSIFWSVFFQILRVIHLQNLAAPHEMWI